MSRFSFVIGLVISLGLHSLLLINGGAAPKCPEIEILDESPKSAKVILPPKPKPKQPELHKPKPIPRETMETPVQAKAIPAKAPEQIVKPTSLSKVGQGPGDLPESASTDGLPELRLTWESKEQLLTAGRALGFRILAVDPKNQPIGELSLENGITVKRFIGGLKGYSNRVRTIPADFFGSGFIQQVSEPVKCLWILIPASIDIRWVSVQQQAVQSNGLKNHQVSYVEAKIVAANHGYNLEVTKVVTL